MSDPDKPYFAPPAEGATLQGEVPTWGTDAQEIAREAGLGSYGGDPLDQESREEALLRALERSDADLSRTRLTAALLSLITLLLTCALIWLWFAGR